MCDCELNRLTFESVCSWSMSLYIRLVLNLSNGTPCTEGEVVAGGERVNVTGSGLVEGDMLVVLNTYRQEI